MSLLTKTDLIYTYKWKPIPKEDSRIAGIPNSTLFNRNEGFEVLWLINYFAQKKGIDKIETGLQIEKLIQEKMPINLRNQTHCIEWLEQNFTDPLKKRETK